MLDYQIIVILFLVNMLLGILMIGFIESIIKKHKAEKKAFDELVRENKQLKDKIYRLKFNAELRGLKLDD